MVAVIGEVTTEAKPHAATTRARPPVATRAGGGGLSFSEVLSCLNPLQYVPVVGTIYRAVTGDTIPATVREAGGLAFSALTGGPVGVAMTAAFDVAERLTGWSEDDVGQRLLHWLGIGGRGSATPDTRTAASSQAIPGDPVGRPAAAAVNTDAVPVVAFTGTELARASGGGADALNGLELQRLAATATGAYGRSAALG